MRVSAPWASGYLYSADCSLTESHVALGCDHYCCGHSGVAVGSRAVTGLSGAGEEGTDHFLIVLTSPFSVTVGANLPLQRGRENNEIAGNLLPFLS